MMYDDHRSSIPDMDAYLERIGLTREDISPRGRESLDKLIYAHQTHIAFENLDACLYHVPYSLAVADLFDKMVTRKRGGYCYEMNGLFARVLADLGYDVISVFCRIVNGRDFIPHCSHRGSLVRIGDDLLYVDVGYGGPQPPCSVLVKDGEETIGHGEAFQIRKYDGQWWCLSRTDSSGIKRDIIHFNTFAQTPQEFIPINYFASHSPDSIFTQKIMLNRRTETGSVNLTDLVFTRIENGERSSKEFKSFEETKELLREEFFLEVP